MKRRAQKNKELIIFIIYAGITFSLLFFHENWRDEAQAWLLSRDCSLSELVDAMQYEGHFLLWYLILMPFAKLGFPYFTTNVISWFITCVAVWLLLHKMPFNFTTRALLIFTFPLLYLYPVISRCYCLIPLAVVLMGISYKDRKEKPLCYLLSIILLLNTHVIMAGMAGVALLDFIGELYGRRKDLFGKEKRKNIVSLVIATILILISIWPLIGCLSTNKELNTRGEFAQQIFEACTIYPLLLFRDLYDVLSHNSITLILYRVILLIILVTMVYEIKYAPLDCLKIWSCLIWQSLIYSLIYPSSEQRGQSIIFIVLFFIWISSYKDVQLKEHNSFLKGKLEELCVYSLIAANILCGCMFIMQFEIPHKFSNAHEMAYYINKNLRNGSIILSGPKVEYISSLIPYIRDDIRFFHLSGNRYFSYVIWDDLNKEDINIENLRKVKSIFSNKEKLYYIFCNRIKTNGKNDGTVKFIDEMSYKGVFKLLFMTKAPSLTLEDYCIYEIELNKI